MPDTTPELDIPYPVDTDDADVPEDMQALAERVEAIIAGGHVSGAAVAGDTKTSVRDTDHGRWLKLDGRELTQAQIETALSLPAGSAADFVALMKTGSISLYGAAATGKVKLADSRRRMPMHAGPGIDGSGDFSARALGAVGGAEAVQLSSAQSGLPSHTHSISSVGGGEVTAENLDSLWDGDPLGIRTGYDADTLDTQGPNNSQFPTRAPRDIVRPYGSGWTHESATNYCLLKATISAVAAAPTVQDAAQAHNNMPPFVALGWGFIRV